MFKQVPQLSPIPSVALNLPGVKPTLQVLETPLRMGRDGVSWEDLDGHHEAVTLIVSVLLCIVG